MRYAYAMNPWMNLFRAPDLLAQIALNRDAHAFFRIHFLWAMSATGLLVRLRSWASREELAKDFGVGDPGLLEALLDVGVALRELTCDGSRYRIKGKRSEALARQGGDALVAALDEYVTYHSAVYRDLPGRLSDGRPGEYLRDKGPLVARSSRMLEPFMVDFVRRTVAGKGTMRLLEVGCGSGIYLRHASGANPSLTGIGIDIEGDVVRETSARLVAWGIDDRFKILLADARSASPELRGPFDLITLYNNIYYFRIGERTSLLTGLRERLCPGGALAIISLFDGGSAAAAHFDFVLRSTAGCAAMGTLEELVRQLRESGFGEITSVKLMPGQPFHGVIARRS